jgi:hypothetical protein
LIAWDELPAANVAWLDCVDELCRSLKHKDYPFGGIPFLGVGDFRQVAPVVKGAGSTPSRLASIKSSHIWCQFFILTLQLAIRSAHDPGYTTFVDAIGEDYVRRQVILDLIPTLPSLEDCINFFFPEGVLTNPLSALKRAFLSPKNVQVDEFNDAVLEQLHEPERPSNSVHPFLSIGCALTAFCT